MTTISSGKDYIPDLYKNLASKFWTNKEPVLFTSAQILEATMLAVQEPSQKPPLLMADVSFPNFYIYLCLIYPDTISIKYICWVFHFEVPSIHNL